MDRLPEINVDELPLINAPLIDTSNRTFSGYFHVKLLSNESWECEPAQWPKEILSLSLDINSHHNYLLTRQCLVNGVEQCFSYPLVDCEVKPISDQIFEFHPIKGVPFAAWAPNSTKEQKWFEILKQLSSVATERENKLSELGNDLDCCGGSGGCGSSDEASETANSSINAEENENKTFVQETQSRVHNNAGIDEVMNDAPSADQESKSLLLTEECLAAMRLTDESTAQDVLSTDNQAAQSQQNSVAENTLDIAQHRNDNRRHNRVHFAENDDSTGNVEREDNALCGEVLHHVLSNKVDSEMDRDRADAKNGTAAHLSEEVCQDFSSKSLVPETEEGDGYLALPTSENTSESSHKVETNSSTGYKVAEQDGTGSVESSNEQEEQSPSQQSWRCDTSAADTQETRDETTTAALETKAHIVDQNTQLREFPILRYARHAVSDIAQNIQNNANTFITFMVVLGMALYARTWRATNAAIAHVSHAPAALRSTAYHLSHFTTLAHDAAQHVTTAALSLPIAFIVLLELYGILLVCVSVVCLHHTIHALCRLTHILTPYAVHVMNLCRYLCGACWQCVCSVGSRVWESKICNEMKDSFGEGCSSLSYAVADAVVWVRNAVRAWIKREKREEAKNQRDSK